MSEVKKTITLADRSTKALTKVVAEGAKVFADLQTLALSTVSLSEEIEFKEGQLNDIANKIDISEREAKANLRLRVIENEDKVVADILRNRGLVSISSDELSTLRFDLGNARGDNEQAIAEARKAGYAEATAKANADIRDKDSKHSVELAEFKAQATAKATRISDLEDQVNELRAQITAERETRLEIAKAEANRQGVVVNAGKN